MVHPSCRSICHSSEPQTSTVCVSSPRPNARDIDALNISGRVSLLMLTLLLLSFTRLSKIRQFICLIIIIAPGWPGMPWFWDLVQLSTDHTSIPLLVSTTLLKQSHNYVLHSKPLHLNLSAWYLGMAAPRTRFLCGGGRENCCPSKGRWWQSGNTLASHL